MNSKFYNVIKPIIDYTLMAVCFVMIIITGIKEKSHPISVWPLINSLFIMILSMRAYRIAHLLGSINCLIYSIGFFMIGMYGSLISTLCVSFPLQFITFFVWGKRKFKRATMFRKLPIIWEIVLTIGVIGACIVGAMLIGI
jgi:nicotinamide riboside transporter PnuC